MNCERCQFRMLKSDNFCSNCGLSNPRNAASAKAWIQKRPGKCDDCGGLLEPDRYAICEKCERRTAESIDHFEELDMIRPVEGEEESA